MRKRPKKPMDGATHADDPHHTVRLAGKDWLLIFLGVVVLWLLLQNSFTGFLGTRGGRIGAELPSIWSVIPFAGLLISVALFPLLPFTMHWWESNKNRLMLSLCFAALTLAYYGLRFGPSDVVAVLEHAVLDEYIPFIVLLFSLYVISGGIRLHGDLIARPTTNVAFLAVGTAIASFVGTTGASMLLIRPLLQTNAQRRYVRHTVIFFIFLVSNIGGCLLPIGDPPLFLGYLKGVPFLWTLTLWKPWLLMSAVVLAVYYLWECRLYRRESATDLAMDEQMATPLRIEGKRNLILLAGVVPCVALVKPGEPLPGLDVQAFPYLRELLMLSLSALSIILTPTRVRHENRFNYHAILEVAALFIGIFICMQAPIEILRASGSSLAPYLSSPTHFYWATGALSSFLDNAPTYVVFFETAASMTPADATGALRLQDGTTIMPAMLVAISLGSVFMGAMSYIGNGPNFMVKSIAEQAGVRMPSFFGYMLFSIGILVPLFVVVTAFFL